MSAKKHTNPAYISHVHLKGYKSIIDTEVELHPGLNIIIGPNGSGKTNFLEFIERIFLYFKGDLFSSFEGEIDFFPKNENSLYKYKFRRKIGSPSKDQGTNILLSEELTKNGKLVKKFENSQGSVIYRLTQINNFFPNYIKFGLPNEVENLSNSITAFIHPNLQQELGKEVIKETFYLYNPVISEGVGAILKDFLDITFFVNQENSDIEALGIIENISKNLERYSPINSIRIVPEPKILDDKDRKRVDFLNFEFLVDDKWLNWNQLSDGTKRLFYIISEVTLNEGLCLVEEPELGMYPEQLDLIMLFLQQQAKHKQIIITTHAPRILDFLGDDELNRIILTRYIQEIGTKMHHLSEEDIQLIIEHREKKGYTSDLWTMTSFFDEEEETV